MNPTIILLQVKSKTDLARQAMREDDPDEVFERLTEAIELLEGVVEGMNDALVSHMNTEAAHRI